MDIDTILVKISPQGDQASKGDTLEVTSSLRENTSLNKVNPVTLITYLTHSPAEHSSLTSLNTELKPLQE